MDRHPTQYSNALYSKGGKSFSAVFLSILESYPWPGNVRQLAHSLETAYAFAMREPMLMPHHLPEEIRIHAAKSALQQGSPSPLAVSTGGAPTESDLNWRTFKSVMIRQYLENLMETAKSDVGEASRISGLSRPHLYSLLKKHGLSRDS